MEPIATGHPLHDDEGVGGVEAGGDDLHAVRMADLTQREGITPDCGALNNVAKCALKNEANSHFGLERNFLRKFLQVSVVQFELYLRELDGDFNSIHVRMMHDACESSLVTEYHDHAISCQ